MNSKIVFAVLAVCFAQLAYCRVAVREAPVTVSPWTEALEKSNETLKQFHDSFLHLFGVRSDDELWNKAKQQFTTLETNLRSGIANLQEETKPLQGKAQELVKAFTDKVTEVQNELKAKNPELFSGDAQKLQNVAERSLNTIVDETKKLRTRLEAEGQQVSPKLEEALKSVYNSAVSTAKGFKEQVDTTINNISKGN